MPGLWQSHIDVTILGTGTVLFFSRYVVWNCLDRISGRLVVISFLETRQKRWKLDTVFWRNGGDFDIGSTAFAFVLLSFSHNYPVLAYRLKRIVSTPVFYFMTPFAGANRKHMLRNTENLYDDLVSFAGFCAWQMIRFAFHLLGLLYQTFADHRKDFLSSRCQRQSAKHWKVQSSFSR